MSTPANARLIRRYEPPFAIDDFVRCAGCFDSVNRINLRVARWADVGPRKLSKAADDHQDRPTAFATSADLSLDPDDGAFHRPPLNRRGAVFRHAAARMVADRGGLRSWRLRQRAGLHLEPDRQAGPARLHMGAVASSGFRLAPFRLGPRLWL